MKRNPISAATLFLLVLLTWTSRSFADGDLQGEVRFQVADDDLAWVGQQRQLNLELWTNGFSFADQLFTLPGVNGGYLLQADSSTVKLSENRGGVQWQGLRYNLLLYPQRDGPIQIPSFEVSFTARAGFGSAPASFRFDTDNLVVETRWPPGVEPGALLVTTESFSMDSSWSQPSSDSDPVQLKVGDAITLTVKRTAQDVPGMVFNPLPEFDIEGLGVYPDAPQLEDRVVRGSLTGVRSDTVTFICEREGAYRIPGMVFQWWNPRSERLEESRIQPLELTVEANPAWKSAAAGAGSGSGPSLNRYTVSLLAISMLLLGAAWRFGLPALRQYLQQRKTRIEAGESWAFRQVRQACDDGNPVKVYRSINRWLSRLESLPPGCTLLELAERTENVQLKKEATALQERVASGLTEDWSAGLLTQLLMQSRERLYRSLNTGQALSALNPPLTKSR